MSASYQQLAISKIDTSNNTFSICPQNNCPSNELIESIRKFGVIHPPLLQKSNDKKYIIISGKKRILACLSNNPPESITGLILPKNIDPATLYHYLLIHALTGSQLSIVEQAIFLKKASQVFQDEDILQFLKHFGYKPQAHFIQNLLKILSLDKSIINHLHEGILHPRIIRYLYKLSPFDQIQIGTLIDKLKLGGSKQLKLTEMLYELQRRNNEPLCEIIRDWEKLPDTTEKKNLPQLTNTLFQWLNAQCYPKKTEAEAEFHRFSKTLKVPTNVQLFHSKSFEDDQVSLSITFNNKNELIHAWKTIKPFIKP